MKVATVPLTKPHPSIDVVLFERTGVVRLTQDDGDYLDVIVLSVDEVPNLIAALQAAQEQP